MYVCVCAHVCTRVHVYVCMCMQYVCVHACAFVCMHGHTLHPFAMEEHMNKRTMQLIVSFRCSGACGEPTQECSSDPIGRGPTGAEGP